MSSTASMPARRRPTLAGCVIIRPMLRFLEPRKTLAVAAAGALLAGVTHPPTLRAQSTPLRFEAASVKLSTDQRILETRPRRTIGRFRWKTQFLYLLGYAYDMEWWRISDAPDTSPVSFGSI